MGDHPFSGYLECGCINVQDEQRRCSKHSSPLDLGIAHYVNVLENMGVETFESCEGGGGHAFPVPTIRFHGNHAEGYRALSIALTAGLPVFDLRRSWPIIDGELTGPYWELTFRNKA